MAKNDNLTDFLTDLANAIRAKKGTLKKINPQNFASEIASISSGDGNSYNYYGWTGRADVEGLRAIGWDDGSIDEYQYYGVNWNKEDDDLHKVSDANKALYGVLTVSNINAYANDIVYLPKIDISSVQTLNGTFKDCHNMVAIPWLDTQHITNMGNTFRNCYSLVTIPMLDVGGVTSMTYMFANCYSLVRVPAMLSDMVTTMTYMFNNCTSLIEVEELHMGKVTNTSTMFNECHSIKDVNLVYLNTSIQFEDSNILDKSSLIFIISGAISSSTITIKLAPFAYERFENDPDIVALLESHPNITLAQ